MSDTGEFQGPSPKDISGSEETEARIKNRTERITGELMTVMIPLKERTIQDQSPEESLSAAMKPLKVDNKPQPDGRYRATNHTNGIGLGEVLDRVVVSPAMSNLQEIRTELRDTIATQLGFSDEQMRYNLDDVTGGQIEKIAEMIEGSGMPLIYSSTEDELAHELSLASGRKITGLSDVVTLAEKHIPPKNVFVPDQTRLLLNLPEELTYERGHVYPVVVKEEGGDPPHPEARRYMFYYESQKDLVKLINDNLK